MYQMPIGVGAQFYPPNFNQQTQSYNQSFNQFRQEQLGGKVVDSIDVVRVTDVPMDGQTYYFPKADGTEVYSKRWLNNGTTQIMTFKNDFSSQTSISTPVTEKRENDANATLYNRCLEQIKSLEERVENLESRKVRKKVDLNDAE